MELTKLVTYSFDRNVGAGDRIFRVLSGLGLAGVGWYFALPVWASVTLSVIGVAWSATGVVSRCAMYYLLGYSTCPAGGGPNPLRKSAT